MRLRWLGKFLVALAILVGTPIAATVARRATLACGADLDPLRDEVFIVSRGVLIYHAHPPYNLNFMTSIPDPPKADGPVELEWSASGDSTLVKCPIWPVPIGIGVIGGLVWFGGARRSAGLAGARTSRFPATANLRSLASLLTVGAGLGTASLVAMSFLNPISLWVHLANAGSREYILRAYRLDRGALRASILDERGLFQVSRPPAGPLTFSSWSNGANRELVFPIWPVPVVMLAIGGTAFVRRERSLLAVREGHCLKCGYDLAATPGPVCPECGVRRS